MPRWFLSEREGKRRGELTDPFVSLERNVELEATRGGVGRLHQEGAASTEGSGVLDPTWAP